MVKKGIVQKKVNGVEVNFASPPSHTQPTIHNPQPAKFIALIFKMEMCKHRVDKRDSRECEGGERYSSLGVQLMKG